MSVKQEPTMDRDKVAEIVRAIVLHGWSLGVDESGPADALSNAGKYTDRIMALALPCERCKALEAALESFAHIASRFEEWGIEGEESVLRIENGNDVLTEIFTRPFIRAAEALAATRGGTDYA